jgi:hypothetical protein
MALTLVEIAFLVSDRLRRMSVEAILTGGACVTIYTSHKYQSFDLDFVLRAHQPPVLIRLEHGRFSHPESDFFVEILPPPPSVGEEPIRKCAIRRRGRLRLDMLMPTDCVKDRLAAFYHWKDKPSLAQAVLVAAAQKVDLKDIARWSKAEGMDEPYQAFRRALRDFKATSPTRSARRRTS